MAECDSPTSYVFFPDNLLNNFAEDLCLCGEKVQSELAYIFIFLSPLQTQMSPRLLQNLQTGTLALLSTAQRKESQLNGLGDMQFIFHIIASLNDSEKKGFCGKRRKYC